MHDTKPGEAIPVKLPAGASIQFIHKVTDSAGDVHLVATRSPRVAARHVARKLRGTLSVRLAGPEEIARAAQVGIEVEWPYTLGDAIARWLSFGLGLVLVVLLVDLLARAVGMGFLGVP